MDSSDERHWKSKGRRLQLERDTREYDSSKRFSYITDQGMIVTMTCDMGTIKGYDLNEDGARNESNKVGFWSFMTMSEKIGWLNDTIALVTFEATDPMWMEMNITIWEWK